MENITVKTRTAVSTKTKVAIAIGVVALAAAAAVGPYLQGKGSVTIISPTNRAVLSGAAQFDAKVKIPGGYTTKSVTFTEKPGGKTYVGQFVSASSVWRAPVDTTQLANGSHSVEAIAVFSKSSGRGVR